MSSREHYDPKQGKVLVTGGAGFLGINLIRYLLEKGSGPISSLDIASFDYPEKDRIDVIGGDIRDRMLLERIVPGTRWLIHAAAALPLYSREDIHSTEVTGTRNLLEAALKNRVERFIYISSTAVYGLPDRCPIQESDELIGVGPYGRTKIEAEELCKVYRDKGLCVSVLRPKSFVGPERLGVFELLYCWAAEGRNFPVVGRGDNRYQLLDVEDLCQAIFLCASLDPEIVNAVFNIGAEEFTTLREDFQAVLDAAGCGKRVFPFPGGLAVAGLKLLELLHLSPLYDWIYKTAGKDSVVSIEKAKEMLGYHPTYSNREALLRGYRWYLENRDRVEKAPGISHRRAWRHGFLDIIKAFF